jgi:predicted HicB family RNase H-like nuclease
MANSNKPPKTLTLRFDSNYQHRRFANAAKERRQSLNQYILAALEHYTGPAFRRETINGKGRK